MDEKVPHGAYIPQRATASDQGNKKFTSFGDEKCCEEYKRGLCGGGRVGGQARLKNKKQKSRLQLMTLGVMQTFAPKQAEMASI